MIEIKVKKKLGDFLLDAQIADENFICVTGRNGSGKTSLLNIIAGIFAPDDGFVKVGSKNITHLPIEKREVALVTPDSFIPQLEVEQHLRWGAKIKGIRLDEERVTETKKSLGITFSGKMSKLSLGMRERVSLATALLSTPKVILVDEAFSNLDTKEECIIAYRELSKISGIDVIFTTQDRGDSKPADHLYEMNNGLSIRVF